MSEETGHISIAEDGKLHVCTDSKDLAKRLRELMKSETMQSSIKSIFTEPEEEAKEKEEDVKKEKEV